MNEFAYYVLPDDRWQELSPILTEAYGANAESLIPSPLVARAIVAENVETRTIVGVAFLQLLAHFDTLCLHAEHGGVSVGKMFDIAKASVGRGGFIYSMVMDDKRARAAAERNGMAEITAHRVFVCEV